MYDFSVCTQEECKATLEYWNECSNMVAGPDYEHRIARAEIEDNDFLGLRKDYDNEGRLLGIDGLPV